MRKCGYLPFNSDWDVYSRLDRVIDVLIASSSHLEIHSAKSILKSNFRIAELGLCTYLPGNDYDSKSHSKTTTPQPIYLSRARIREAWDMEMQTCGLYPWALICQ